jgi:hypothetical protein
MVARVSGGGEAAFAPGEANMMAAAITPDLQTAGAIIMAEIQCRVVVGAARASSSRAAARLCLRPRE